MTKILCKIIGRDEELGGNTLKIGFPDENGQVVTVPFDPSDEDADTLTVGMQGTFGIVPLVPTTHPDADPEATPNAAGLVPVDHPTVLDPEVAGNTEPALPSTIQQATAPVVATTATDAGDAGTTATGSQASQ